MGDNGVGFLCLKGLLTSELGLWLLLWFSVCTIGILLVEAFRIH